MFRLLRSFYVCIHYLFEWGFILFVVLASSLNKVASRKLGYVFLFGDYYLLMNCDFLHPNRYILLFSTLHLSGDLFFDLFYVAAAYNLGIMLCSSLNEEHWFRGIIYYIGMFGPLFTTWETSMFYESRYTTVDYAHRLFEVVRYLFVSIAVVHVKSINLLADSKSAETLLFTCAILCESIVHLTLNVEVYFKGLGDTGAIQNHTIAKIKQQLLPLMLVYTVAVITAAVLYARPDADNGEYNGRLLADTDDEYGNHTGQDNNYTERSIWELSDLPLTLTAIGYLQNIVSMTRKVRATDGKFGNIRFVYCTILSVALILHAMVY